MPRLLSKATLSEAVPSEAERQQIARCTPWLLASVLATAMPHALYQPLWLTGLAVLMLLWRTLLWRQRQPLPARWLLLVIVLTGTAAVLVQFRTLFGRDAGVALLFLFATLKPLELRSRRDAVVLIMLGYFLLLTHYFHSQAIAVGIWLLAAATLLTATLMRLSGDDARPLRSLSRAATLLLQATPFMLIFFVLFPRIPGPLWGLPADAHAGRTGLSATMTPGNIAELIQNGTIAFRARFDGTPPTPSRLYWRGPVLDVYDGREWRPAPATGKAAPPRLEALAPELAYELTLEAHNQRWILALDLPTRVPPGMVQSDTFELLARSPLRERQRFSLSASTDFRINTEEAPEILQRALGLPEGYNPRTRALAARWRNELGAPHAIVAAALRHFRETEFYYTLRPPLLGTHAMDDFLFVTRRGFCEHYASAFVVLMRAAGIPARVVTGYQGGEINPVDAHVVVRQSDAHAWAEVWLAGAGWMRVDPTAAVAPSRIEQGILAALAADEPLPFMLRLEAGWLQGMRYRWEALNNNWNQWVLGYNPERQRQFLARLGWPDADWRSLVAAMALLCGGALIGLTLWTLYRRPAPDPALAAWEGLCRRLAGHGITRAAWEGPAAFAARVAQARPDLANVVHEGADCYMRLRYGRPGPGPDQTADLATLRACRRRIPRPIRFRWRSR